MTREILPTGSQGTSRTIYQIISGLLFDPIARTLLPNQVITVDGDSGIILDVSPGSHGKGEEIAEWMRKQDSNSRGISVKTFDFSHLIVLPGLVDVHVHFFLHPYSEASWDDQVTKESLAERTIRATNHARKTLMAGFTTVRDLGTEGAFDADIGLRKCLSGRSAIIPGPRYYCSTRGIISSGSYGPRSSLYPAQEGIDGVVGVQSVDGVDECVKEVRRQIGAGADWIKIYADYRCRARQSDVSKLLSTRSITTFNRDELSAMIKAAHTRGVKVAAHAKNWEVISTLLDVGIDSIEHGHELINPSTGDRSLVEKFIDLGSLATWVPTLSAYYTLWLDAGGDKATGGHYKSTWESCKATFKEVVLKTRMDNIACGGDTGVFAHGKNALELVLMRRLGAEWERVLGWATYGGWKCVRGKEWEGEEGYRKLQEAENIAQEVVDGTADLAGRAEMLDRDVPFGALRAGWAADLIGVEGTLDGSVDDFEDAMMNCVKFVMKGGKIYKLNGLESLN